MKTRKIISRKRIVLIFGLFLLLILGIGAFYTWKTGFYFSADSYCTSDQKCTSPTSVVVLNKNNDYCLNRNMIISFNWNIDLTGRDISINHIYLYQKENLDSFVRGRELSGKSNGLVIPGPTKSIMNYKVLVVPKGFSINQAESTSYLWSESISYIPNFTCMYEGKITQ